MAAGAFRTAMGRYEYWALMTDGRVLKGDRPEGGDCVRCVAMPVDSVPDRKAAARRFGVIGKLCALLGA